MRRRALPALGMTVAGLIMLLRFQTSPSGGATVGALPGPAGSGTAPGTTAPGTTPPGTTPGSTPGGGAGPSGSGGAPTTTPNPGTSPASGPTDGTYDGAEIQTRYGPVKVQITISGGQLTDVQELEVPSDRQRSVEINSQAGPILRSEALTAQSASLDQVSGATITWGAYEQSLQAALDAANK
ncbi:MAG: hypothetical protein JWM89_1101 [Acidimicrobiales bacterium]|nr:hypothetical protein [Acidimicrobiales bacterium]